LVVASKVPEVLDRLLDPAVRAQLEQRYWQPIEAQARWEVLVRDPRFLDDPGRHLGLFSDHGVVHARDVAVRAVESLAEVNGVLIARREPDRLAFMAELLCASVFLHDIGMVDASPGGRRVHAEFAAQEPFRERFDDLVDGLWGSPGGALRQRAEQVRTATGSPVDGPTLVRELLSLTMCHSKSAVPGAVLDDRAALRERLQDAVLTPLGPDPGDGPAVRCYDDPERDAYAWLASPDPTAVSLADDAIDAMRVLRSADALRQRGTTLRTSAGYEVFIDPGTGRAVFALRSSDRTWIAYLRVGHPLSAGEANVRIAELTPTGDLRLAFHHGAFATADAAEFAVEAAATVAADIAADVLVAFDADRPAAGLAPPSRRPGSTRLRLVQPHDDPTFAERVLDSLARHHPDVATRADVAPEDEPALPPEPPWPDPGTPVEPGSADAEALLRNLAASGLRTDRTERADPARAVAGVRRVRVASGRTVITAGRRASSVIVPLAEGLEVRSLGGYRPQPARPWVPIGITGVVRGAERNSQIVARRDLDVVLIPAATFLAHWFHPYDEDELPELAGRLA
jgi:hypothetical protein